jgi:predicted SnoaL-like aldol condensation-catalyzing enzyme
MTDQKTLEDNKNKIRELMRLLIDPATARQAERLMTPSYIQHNPNIASGREAIIQFTQTEAAQRARENMVPAGEPFLMAEGDYVVMMLPRRVPHPHKPGETYMSYWFDMWRLENGLIAEHWDGAPLE